MYFKRILLNLLAFFSFSCQTKELEDTTVDYYLNQLEEIKLKEFITQNLYVDKKTIAPEYKDVSTNTFNKEGLKKSKEIENKLFKKYFYNYYFLQKTRFNETIYSLYFTMNDKDNINWFLSKTNKENWYNIREINREEVLKSSRLNKILWSYNSQEKNKEHPSIFINNKYLIVQQGNLNTILFDLITEKAVISEEINKDISKENVHIKIQEYLKK